jgi:hypothetical protein
MLQTGGSFSVKNFVASKMLLNKIYAPSASSYK